MTRTSRRLAAVLIVALAAVALSACSANAGSTAVSQLEKRLASVYE